MTLRPVYSRVLIWIQFTSRIQSTNLFGAIVQQLTALNISRWPWLSLVQIKSKPFHIATTSLRVVRAKGAG